MGTYFQEDRFRPRDQDAWIGYSSVPSTGIEATHQYNLESMTAEPVNPDRKYTVTRGAVDALQHFHDLAGLAAKTRDAHHMQQIRDQVASQLPEGTEFTITVGTQDRTIMRTPTNVNVYIGRPDILSNEGTTVEKWKGTGSTTTIPETVTVQMPAGNTATPKVVFPPPRSISREPGEIKTGKETTVPADTRYDRKGDGQAPGFGGVDTSTVA